MRLSWQPLSQQALGPRSPPILLPTNTLPTTQTAMIFAFLRHLLSCLLDLLAVLGRSAQDKDLEILLLGHQLRILQRKHPHPPRLSRWEKRTLLVLAGPLTRLTYSAGTRIGQRVFRFKPETLLKGHRERLRRKWTFRIGRRRGRPPISARLTGLTSAAVTILRTPGGAPNANQVTERWVRQERRS